MRKFETGATRDVDTGKPDYEGYLSPRVLKAFGEYMTAHRYQADGSLRDSDNWQRGIPLDAYMKSDWRHFFDMWTMHRGLVATDHTGKAVTMRDTLSAIMFNTMGYFHEWLKAEQKGDVIPHWSNHQEDSIPTITECPYIPKPDPCVQGSCSQQTTPEERMIVELVNLNCPHEVAKQIAKGTTAPPDTARGRFVYLSGPMRGLPEENFPAFDKARDGFLARGYTVISPADIDRAAGHKSGVFEDSWTYIERDYYALKLVATYRGVIGMIGGHEQSKGAMGELFLSQWGGIPIVNLNGDLMRSRDFSFGDLAARLATTLDGQKR